MKLSSINTLNLRNAAKMVIVMPIALVSRLFRPNLWIITERPDQARDNGYCFFKYLRQEQSQQDVCYIITRNAKDRKKLDGLGEVVDFDSWRHYYYYCLSKVHISAHVGGCNPNNNPFARRIKKMLNYNNVFIPHGVSYGISEFCLAKYKNIDLFLCSGKQEYENVLDNYGYRFDQVAYTGFPRLDSWHRLTIYPKQILLMPTWRMYIAQDPGTVFEKTAYYNVFQDLIDSPEISRILEKYDLKLIFYLHNDMRKYANSFKTTSNRIEIVTNDEQFDIQTLLKTSVFLITDYSSVHFDFAYMGKPVLYFQFDQDDFYSRQYQKGYFDFVRDGFGPVCMKMSELIRELERSAENGFVIDDKYYKRMRDFYSLYDAHNCDRVFAEIQRRFKCTH